MKSYYFAGMDERNERFMWSLMLRPHPHPPLPQEVNNNEEGEDKNDKNKKLRRRDDSSPGQFFYLAPKMPLGVFQEEQKEEDDDEDGPTFVICFNGAVAKKEKK